MSKVIVAAAQNIDQPAEDWLTKHGAHVEYSGELRIIELPKEAHLEHGARDLAWQYIIWFYNAEGNYEPSYVEIELDVDAYETRLVWHETGMD